MLYSLLQWPFPLSNDSIVGLKKKLTPSAYKYFSEHRQMQCLPESTEEHMEAIVQKTLRAIWKN